jgi:hypothetical protein
MAGFQLTLYGRIWVTPKDLFSRRHYVATHTKYEWKGNWSARHEAPGCRSKCLQ